MILILTMAGRYTRFINEGYITPKYLLPWVDKTILSKLIFEIKKGDVFSDIFLIANKRDNTYMPHVRAIMRDYAIGIHNLYQIADTCGQAETAAVGLDLIGKNRGKIQESIVFHNVDTILYKRDYWEVKTALQNNAGYIDVFRSNHHDYSYVIVDEKNIISGIEEKLVISDMATSGLYGFSSLEKFSEYYDIDEDIYISSIYKKMIAAGENVIIGKVYSPHDTIVLGTPEEYINASVMVDTMPLI